MMVRLQRHRGEADCVWEGGSELVGRDRVVFREELPAMGVRGVYEVPKALKLRKMSPYVDGLAGG